MPAALLHFVGFVFACAFAWVGRFMLRNPEKAARIITLGQRASKFSLGYCRIVGRVFLVAFSLGALMYLIFIPLDLFGVKIAQ